VRKYGVGCFITGKIAKIRFFAPQGRLVAPIQIKLAWPTGTWVHMIVQNFTSIATGGWECGPEISKISTFW